MHTDQREERIKTRNLKKSLLNQETNQLEAVLHLQFFRHRSKPNNPQRRRRLEESPDGALRGPQRSRVSEVNARGTMGLVRAGG